MACGEARLTSSSGRAAYMSPEQARGRPVVNRADIWAFGCVVYEMLPPVRRVCARARRPTRLRQFWSASPIFVAAADRAGGGLRSLIKRCLAKDPRHRLRDIGDARLRIDEMRWRRRDPARRDAAPGAGEGAWSGAAASAACRGRGGGRHRAGVVPQRDQRAMLATPAQFTLSLAGQVPDVAVGTAAVAVSRRPLSSCSSARPDRRAPSLWIRATRVSGVSPDPWHRRSKRCRSGRPMAVVDRVLR